MVEAAKKSGIPAKKAAYTIPTLTVFGSVRELTGSNSGSHNGDGGTMMSME